MSQFQVRKDDFATCRIQATDDVATRAALADGEILLKVDRFAFTANNITYAATGDTLGYWKFFPPVGGDADGWGVTPVWGFADVVESKAPDVAVGERLYGYFPPASFLTVLPVRLTPTRLFDGSAHRTALPPGYNSYSRVQAEKGYEARMDDSRMLLWPLHVTSFCLWDMLADQGWFGARQVLILSASSKTSIGLAYALAADSNAPPAIAVTSRRNSAFVGSLDVYQQVVTYEAIESVDASVPTVIVDMSGNRDVLNQLQAHLGEQLKRCINVGLTHWDTTADVGPIAEHSEFFFAPGHIQRRMKEWGVDEFSAKSSAFLRDTAPKSQRWLEIVRLNGLDGLAEVYADACEGRLAPNQGLIVEMPR